MFRGLLYIFCMAFFVFVLLFFLYCALFYYFIFFLLCNMLYYVCFGTYEIVVVHKSNSNCDGSNKNNNGTHHATTKIYKQTISVLFMENIHFSLVCVFLYMDLYSFSQSFNGFLPAKQLSRRHKTYTHF